MRLIHPNDCSSLERSRAFTKIHATLSIALVVWLFVEAGLQWRSHLRFGQSIFNMTASSSQYALNPITGMKLLRPNAVMGGVKQSIRTNSHGLRSDEIPFTKPQGQFRIAVLGASTVMGAYARDNESTFPAQLQSTLRSKFPNRHIDVINAGVPGLTLSDQARLYERLISLFKPDIVIIYPGFNDFATYCHTPTGMDRPKQHKLVNIELPSWLLSVDLLIKNSSALRETSVRSAKLINADQLNIDGYQKNINHLFKTIEKSGAGVVVATNAKSYRRSQSEQEQSRLAITARYYNPCFDTDGLHTLYERHNALIATQAAIHGIAVAPLDSDVPGGYQYFVDSSHFSARGESLVAESLAALLERENLLSPSYKP